MGHLFYTELGNSENHDTSSGSSGLQNTGDFYHLDGTWPYWSGTEKTTGSTAWSFNMRWGSQDVYNEGFIALGLALRSGNVSAVPIPGALWLLGSGLLGLLGIKRRQSQI